MTAPEYTCPGRSLPQPPDAPESGYVACYLAGHDCPPKVTLTSVDETHRTTEQRCPCCGEAGVSFCAPLSWGSDLNRDELADQESATLYDTVLAEIEAHRHGTVSNEELAQALVAQIADHLSELVDEAPGALIDLGERRGVWVHTQQQVRQWVTAMAAER